MAANDLSKKRVLCNHCQDYVSKRTYYDHKRLYFDTRSQKWSDKRVFNPLPDATDDTFHITSSQSMDIDGK